MAKTSTQHDSGGLTDLTLLTADKTWMTQVLTNHYGRVYHRPPYRGIYHEYSDTEWRIPEHTDPLLTRADAYATLPEPFYAYNGFDCEDFAMDLYTTLTKAEPRLSVGVLFNHTGEHVFNVFVTEEDGVVEYEPQNGTVVTERGGQYNCDEGILIL